MPRAPKCHLPEGQLKNPSCKAPLCTKSRNLPLALPAEGLRASMVFISGSLHHLGTYAAFSVGENTATTLQKYGTDDMISNTLADADGTLYTHQAQRSILQRLHDNLLTQVSQCRRQKHEG